jgi:hypothetical protein
MLSDSTPTQPERLHTLAKEVLEELREQPAAAAFILGGGVALQHYCEYRDTRDIDAWWATLPEADAEALLRSVMEKVGARHGLSLRMRNWGETQSYELQQSGQTVFSFQVAVRSVSLESPRQSAWPPVQIETLLDNLGAKMNALVARGAPRDFLDVFMVVQRDLTAVNELWIAWSKKNPGKEIVEANVNVLRRLHELETRRPLVSIAEPAERAQAAKVRAWVVNELCRQVSP